MPADDEEESAALFRTPVAPPGSCLSSVLRPLYRHLQEAHRQSKQGHEDEEGEQECSSDSGLSPRLQALCCSSTTTTNSGYNNNNNNSTSSSPSSVSMFFDGPPGMTFVFFSLRCTTAYLQLITSMLFF